MAETDLLVIVPHEDDELAIAGAMIYGAVQQNMRIKVVFVTNGDYFGHEGTIRIKEAGKALTRRAWSDSGGHHLFRIWRSDTDKAPV